MALHIVMLRAAPTGDHNGSEIVSLGSVDLALSKTGVARALICFAFVRDCGFHPSQTVSWRRVAVGSGQIGASRVPVVFNLVKPALAPAGSVYSPSNRWSGFPAPPVIASFTPLRYPIPNPTAQPAAAQPKMARQIRAASNAQTIEASAERSQVIYWARMDPTTNHPASRARVLDANHRCRHVLPG
jgi:hypothetical protein